MSTSSRQMHLGAFLMGVGHHLAAWRHPDVEPRDLFDPAHYLRLAQSAEAAKFDAIFLADNVAMFGGPPEAQARAVPVYHFEPLTLLGLLAGGTQRIGLVATVSATYLPPYHLARKFASLDNLSAGRAGWNCVTSGTDAEARNFGLETQIPHEARYARAHEYIDVVTRLWDSWEDEALLLDKASGRFLDPARLHPLDHVGEHFSVKGPLQSARSVQGRPVIVQAGSSGSGQALAAQTGEVVFTAQQFLEDAVAFAQGVKALAAAAGRGPEEVLVLPGVMPFVAETEAQARAEYEALAALVEPGIGIGLLSALMGWDISTFPLDGPLPDPPQTEGWQSRQQLFVDLARREDLTIRQLVARVAAARGHRVVIGDAKGVADQLEAWFTAGAADGFNILPPTLPAGLEAFNRLVVPELQRRGLFRKEYEGATLREHLGLKRPASSWSASSRSAPSRSAPSRSVGA